MEVLNSSVYIHIPFCKNICSYCDFCKFYYNEKFIYQYLIALKKEIELNYQGELIKTIYIGGGTPSCLDKQQLISLFNIISLFNMDHNIEFTFECNIEDINEELLEFLKNNKVTRLSIGIQTFNQKLLKFLNRSYVENSIDRIKLAKKNFSINLDFIYAIPGQTIDDLNMDLDIALSLDVEHLSFYSLIVEPNTKIYIDKVKSINEELDLFMYQLICKRLSSYHHYEISNFAKEGYESQHNLTYWNNNYYYGFGLSSSGYVNNIRYDNTKSLNKYLKGNYVLNEHQLSLNEQIENEFILGLRKIEGIDKDQFRLKYHFDIHKIEIIRELLNESKLVENDQSISISLPFIYTSNEILVNFLDIDYENVI